jgi:membrane-associated phospholipid phosphatase
MVKRQKYISLVDVVNLIFWSFILIFFLISLPETKYLLQASTLLSGLLFLLFFAVFLRKKNYDNKLSGLIILFYPVVFLLLIFESLHMVMPYIMGNEYDKLLADIDFVMFGFHPTIEIERFVNTVLTEIMYYLYAFYFIMPFFILGYLFIKKKQRELDKSLVFYLLTYYGSYLMYFVVPALGPRFYEPIASFQNLNLEGLWLTETIRNVINTLEHNKYDAFPSLHAAITLTTLITMGQYRKKWLYVFIPVSIGIFISLVYCRYHYVIDIFAGMIWTLISWFLTKKIHSKYFNRSFVSFYPVKNSKT